MIRKSSTQEDLTKLQVIFAIKANIIFDEGYLKAIIINPLSEVPLIIKVAFLSNIVTKFI